MKSKYSVVLPLFFIIINCANCANAGNYIMPLELIEEAKINNCQQVDDFYDRPGMVEPSFIYGYSSGKTEDSAVFWCKNNNQKTYSLVLFYAVKNIERTSCPNITWKNYPGGLSKHDADNFNFNGSYYLDNRKEKFINEPQRSGQVIRSYYDGIENYFYCDDGRWVVKRLD